MHLEQSEKDLSLSFVVNWTVTELGLEVLFSTFSLSVSKADVASSNNNIVGFLMSALAIATRCFCPPDK